MRKVLLATTALVGVAFASGAQAAATSPISLNVGGYVDAVAGFYHEAQSTSTDARTSRDFEVEYKLSFDAIGKASNGVEYGANISLWNGSEAANYWQGGSVVTGTTAASTTGAAINSAYVWTSGAFGKVLLGDEHGASDLFVYAPTVGEGQIDGRFRDFVNARTLAYFQASGIDNLEHSTKVTYYTPKVGNDKHKVQVGVSYAPNMYDYGQSVEGTVASGTTSNYQDVIEGAVQYTGSFNPVSVVASLSMTTASSNDAVSSTLNPVGKSRDFTAWAAGAQVMYNGWTFGGSYADNGAYNLTANQGNDQTVWTLGGKYEFDKVGVALNYMSGEGYANYLAPRGAVATAANTYVSDFNAYGAGATYTWFPGLTSNVDGVLFDQEGTQAAGADKNQGYVVLVSQKLAF